MKIDDLLQEATGRVVPGINTTHDVGPNQIGIEAKKFGSTVDTDGRPPMLQYSGKTQQPSTGQETENEDESTINSTRDHQTRDNTADNRDRSDTRRRKRSRRNSRQNILNSKKESARSKIGKAGDNQPQ